MTRHFQQSLGVMDSSELVYFCQTLELDSKAGTQKEAVFRTPSSRLYGICHSAWHALDGPALDSDILMSCCRVGSDILRNPSAHEEGGKSHRWDRIH